MHTFRSSPAQRNIVLALYYSARGEPVESFTAEPLIALMRDGIVDCLGGVARLSRDGRAEATTWLREYPKSPAFLADVCDIARP